MSAATPEPRPHVNLAVLIDADNAAAAIVEGLFEEIARYGVASVKRIYGDWTQPNLGGWKKVLLDHSIQPMQQFAYTHGKNATDSALIIDAMDLLYTGRFDGFCLVSSDSDFTRLASRLREEGLTVYGFGERKTPKPFVSACDKFIYTELLRADAQPVDGPADAPAEAPAKAPRGAKKDKAEPAAKAEPVKEDAKDEAKASPVPIRLITKVIDDVSDDDGWASLGVVGQNLTKLRPDFDPRLYGFSKLSALMKAQPRIESRQSNKHIEVRVRQR